MPRVGPIAITSENPMSTTYEQKYFTLRGDGFLKQRGVTGAQLRPVGNQNAVSITLNEEVLTIKSKGNKSGTVAREVLDATAEFTAEFDSQSLENTALGLKAEVKTIAAGTGNDFDLPALKEGEAFKLPYGKVSNVVIGSLVAGVDYKVIAHSGLIIALKDCAATAGGTYDNASHKALGVYTAADAEFTYVLYSDKSKRTYEVLRLKFSPGQHDLISDQMGKITLKGEILIDDTVDGSDLPTEIKELGGFVRVTDGS